MICCGVEFERTDWIRPEWRFPQRPADFEQRYPFYTALVPKDFEENLAFRAEMLRFGAESMENKHTLWMMCKRDMLFDINTFSYLVEPRGESGALPFITYEFQDYTLAEIEKAIPHTSLAIEKTRDMGVSWCVIEALRHRWQFKDFQKFMLVSRNELLVDDPENPDSLFWKLRFTVSNRPKYLQPLWIKRQLTLPNHDNQSVVNGSSTTSEIGRGGRNTGVFIDEAAAIPEGYAVEAALISNTNSKIYNSTPKGAAGAFYDKVKPGSKMKKVSLHWTLHPEKSRGLYFDPEGNPRSPWYDYQCNEIVLQVLIAQELDLNYQASQSQFFVEKELRRHEAENVRDPIHIGDIEFDIKERRLSVRGYSENVSGPMLLWAPLRADGRPPPSVYAAGCDISEGTGASNSVLTIFDRLTGTKVCEYRSPNIRPERFAEVAMAVCRWFYECRIAWEANGPGRSFGSRMIELGYGNVYYRQQLKRVTRDTTKEPGWQSGTAEKNILLGEYNLALCRGHYVNRSKEAIDECRQYIRLINGDIVHVESQSKIDVSGARAAHGDRVIADALSWWVARELPTDTPIPDAPPINSIAARWRKIQEKLKPKPSMY